MNNKEHKTKFGRSIAALYILQGINYLLPLLVLPFLVRVLGMERYGLIAFAQSLSQYFVTFTDYGFNFSATRSIAVKRADVEHLSKVVSSTLFLKLAFLVIGAVLLGCVVYFVPRFRSDASFYLVAYLAVAGNVLFPVWFFQGIERMGYISAITGAARLLSALLLFIFVRHPQDALLALALQTGGIVLTGIIGFCIMIVRFSVKLDWVTGSELKSTLAEGWHLFVSTAAMTLYSNTNVFLVGLLAGPTEAGYFSAAEKIIRGAQGLLLPITQGMFPHMASLAEISRQSLMRFAKKALSIIGSVSTCVSIGTFVAAHWISHIIFGANYISGISIIRSISLIPMLSAVNNVLGTQMMIPLRLDKFLSRILIAGGIVNVCIAIPAIRHVGAIGAGISVTLTEFIVMGGMLWYLRPAAQETRSVKI